MNTQLPGDSSLKKRVLHVCQRELLRPLRDQILRISGLAVNSTCEMAEVPGMIAAQPYDLVLIDIEGESIVPAAERLCAEIKTVAPHPLVAFACNWRVAIHSHCPDEVLRTEFDPEAFVQGVHKTLAEA